MFCHLNRLADDSHHPPVNVVFEKVTHVMVPKTPLACNDAPSLAFIRRVCGPFLDEHFVPSGESKFWILYTRRRDW